MTMPSLPSRPDLESKPRRRRSADSAQADEIFGALRVHAFLVEDLPVVRDNLVEAMEEMAPLKFVGHAASESDALQWLDSHPGQWDLAIVDLNLGEGSGLGVLRECLERHPLQKVVVLSNDLHEAVGRQCLALGADQVFDKSADVELLANYCRAQAQQLRTLQGKTRSLF